MDDQARDGDSAARRTRPGIGADAAIKGPRLVVCRRAGPHASARLSLAPIVTARSKGVRLLVSF